jgi:hypothetical protein
VNPCGCLVEASGRANLIPFFQPESSMNIHDKRAILKGIRSAIREPLKYDATNEAYLIAVPQVPRPFQRFGYW